MSNIKPEFKFVFKSHMSMSTGFVYTFVDTDKNCTVVVTGDKKTRTQTEKFTIGETGQSFDNAKDFENAYKKTPGYLEALKKI